MERERESAPLSATSLAFGGFELDTGTGELLRDGQPVPLQPQPLKLLAHLAARPGELVTRAELQKLLWGEFTEVDVEHGLNFCIAQIRAALGDAGGAQGLVETLPRRGYRFRPPASPVAPAVALRERSVEGPAAEPPRLRPVELPAVAPRPPHRARRWRRFLPAGLVVAVLVAGIAWTASRRRVDVASARTHLAAVDARRQGRALRLQADRDAVKKSIAAFEQALLLEPTLPEVRAELAEAYLVSAQGDLWGKEAMTRARTLATEALRADPTSAIAETTLGLVRLQHDWAWEDARRHLERGVALTPSRAEGRVAQAIYLSAMGRPQEAVAVLAPVIGEATPEFVRADLAWHHYFARDYPTAIALWRQVLEAQPQWIWPRMQVVSTLFLMGRDDEAFAEAKTLLGVLGAPASRVQKVTSLPPRAGVLEYFRGRAQNQANAADVGAAVDPIEVAALWAQAGDQDQALSWLERSARERSRWFFPQVTADPVFDSLRSDPRYKLLRDGWSSERER